MDKSKVKPIISMEDDTARLIAVINNINERLTIVEGFLKDIAEMVPSKQGKKKS